MGVLLELLVVVTALTGCVAGLAALWLYLQDRQIVRGSMSVFGEVAENARDPVWVGACLSSAITHNAKHPDGSPVSLPDILQGIVELNMPRFRAYAEEMLPQIIALAFRGDLARELQGKSALAKGVSKLGGGLKGAQALQHGVKSMGGGPLAIIGQLAEAAPALIELVGAMKEMRGGGGGLPSGGSTARNDWRPPV